MFETLRRCSQAVEGLASRLLCSCLQDFGPCLSLCLGELYSLWLCALHVLYGQRCCAGQQAAGRPLVPVILSNCLQVCWQLASWSGNHGRRPDGRRHCHDLVS